MENKKYILVGILIGIASAIISTNLFISFGLSIIGVLTYFYFNTKDNERKEITEKENLIKNRIKKVFEQSKFSLCENEINIYNSFNSVKMTILDNEKQKEYNIHIPIELIETINDEVIQEKINEYEESYKRKKDFLNLKEQFLKKIEDLDCDNGAAYNETIITENGQTFIEYSLSFRKLYK